MSISRSPVKFYGRHRGAAGSSLVALAVLLIASVFPPGQAHGQSSSANTTVKVPTNYKECEALYGDLEFKWVETMLGGDYQRFLNQTQFDHIIPQLCKEGAYEQVYRIAKPFLTSTAPPSKIACEMSVEKGDWFGGASENGYSMGQDAPLELKPQNTSMAPGAPKPPQTRTGRFFIDASYGFASAVETRTFQIILIDYSIGDGDLDATFAPVKGEPKHGTVQARNNRIDLTPLFKGRDQLIFGRGYFGDKVDITIARHGAPIFTMTITLNGLGEVQTAANLAHSRFEEYGVNGRCLPHDNMWRIRRQRPGPRGHSAPPPH